MATTSSMQVADTLQHALERCDLDQILSCYSDDAEIRVIDQDHPPSSPLELFGKQAIADFYKDICGRKMEHHVDSKIVGDGQLALTESCEYPDGTCVVATDMCELSNGKIKRQTTLQAWDK